jgi:glycosyltransferase involved in cell wall biosynthesis
VNPLVSVVLPNYNYARYLKERIRSVLRQSMRDLELIYLDDASTDDSNAVARGLVAEEFGGDPRVQMHCFPENSGQLYRRWNEGAERARGEWLWFAGADDSAHPEFLSHLLELAARHPSAGLVRCNFFRMDTDGSLIGLASDDTMRRPKDRESYFARGEEELRYLARYTYPTASALLIRRSHFEDLGGFNPAVSLAADILFYIQLSARTDVAYSATPYASYRDHRHSFTRTNSMAATDLMKCYCTAQAIRLMADRGNGAKDARALAAREIRFRIATIACTPKAAIPSALSWMLRAIYEVVPDRRLLRLDSFPAERAG